MSVVEMLQKKLRKLQSRTRGATMQIHDLAEDLPLNWTGIKAIARKAFKTFELDAAKEELAVLENSQ